MGISVSFPRSWCHAGVDDRNIPCHRDQNQPMLKNTDVTVSFPESLCRASLDAQGIPFRCDDAIIADVGNIRAKLQSELSIFSEQRNK
jgi:hypothetical protein